MRRSERIEIGRFSRRNLLAFVPDGFGVAFATLVVSSPVAAILYTVFKDASVPARILGGALQLFAYFAIFRWAISIVDSGRTRLWLVRTGLILRSWDQDARRFVTDRVPFRRFGHLTVGRPNCLRLHVGLGVPIRVDVSRFLLEDDTDLLLEHLATHAPDHLYSIDDAGDHAYSRDWSIAELLPDAAAVSALQIRNIPGDRVLFETDDTTWHYHDGDGSVARYGEIDAILRVLRRRRILLDPGIVIASAKRVRPERLEFHLGNDSTLTVLPATGRITLDDELIGTFTSNDAGTLLRFATPTHLVLALISAMGIVSRVGKLG